MNELLFVVIEDCCRESSSSGKLRRVGALKNRTSILTENYFLSGQQVKFLEMAIDRYPLGETEYPRGCKYRSKRNEAYVNYM